MLDRFAWAEELRQLAELAGRLPPPSHRRPEAFHEGRSELSGRLRRLADAMTAPATVPVETAPERRIVTGVAVLARGRSIPVVAR